MKNVGKKLEPVKRLWLYATALMMLSSTGGTGASFFAGNLPKATDRLDEPCRYKIYRSADDFRRQQGECVGYAGTMRVAGFLASTYLKISTPQEVTKISLDTLWGFQKGDQAYRVLGNRLYRILDGGAPIMYEGMGKYQSKNYFSQSLTEPVYWFSKKNLRQVFFENKAFLKYLEDEFAIHRLLQYDTCAGQYLIQNLLLNHT